MSTKKYVDGLIDSLNAESQKKTKEQLDFSLYLVCP